MKKKVLVLACAMVMATSCLVGCGSEDTSTSTPTSEEEVATSEEVEETSSEEEVVDNSNKDEYVAKADELAYEYWEQFKDDYPEMFENPLDFDVTINDKVYTLPCKYEEMASDWSVDYPETYTFYDESDGKCYVEAMSSITTYFINEDGNILEMALINPTNDKVEFSDAYVYRITFVDIEKWSNIQVGGISLDSTKDEVEAIYGSDAIEYLSNNYFIEYDENGAITSLCIQYGNMEELLK